MRGRLSAFANRLVYGERRPPAELLRSFTGRLTRDLPLDELLLQLAESLRRDLGLDAAEVWTVESGVFARRASDPDRGPEMLALSEPEERRLASAPISGTASLGVWLPQLLVGRHERDLRVVPIADSGELLGMMVAERTTGGEPFAEEEERVLVELGRRVGLALRNVRLDSELRASLDELKRQSEELRISRARVVAASDAERRRIERDLHDGAQQHLVSLAVKVRLARELAEDDPEAARAVLTEVSSEVKEALEQLRDLAHGIYPPLLLERGLAEALQAAIGRRAAGGRVEAPALGRYSPDLEATIYFCCLEASQNAAKHAGEAARVSIRIWEEEDGLRFEVADDGLGFDTRSRQAGVGLASMGDRIGALGGRLQLESEPGKGTRVSGVVPLMP